MEFDDFPLSPGHWADGAAFYEAFLKAQEFIATVPAKSRGENPDRLLSQVTSDLFLSRAQPTTLLRARAGAAEAGAAVWLSKVRSLAQWVTVSTRVPPFTGLPRGELGVLARLSKDPQLLPTIADRLLERGVIVVYERAVPGAKVDGAVFKLSSGAPVVGLSLRFPRLDHYWFTLMHELAHIVIHEKQLDVPIVDDLEADRPELVERQADRLASNSLIPSAEWRSCPARYTLVEKDIVAFAERLGIAPQIVAGRIRNDTKRHELFAGLANNVNVREVLLGQD
jgi:HTH-type transcriptional regulator/antitoxin HigA